MLVKESFFCNLSLFFPTVLFTTEYGRKGGDTNTEGFKESRKRVNLSLLNTQEMSILIYAYYFLLPLKEGQEEGAWIEQEAQNDDIIFSNTLSVQINITMYCPSYSRIHCNLCIKKARSRSALQIEAAWGIIKKVEKKI